MKKHIPEMLLVGFVVLLSGCADEHKTVYVVDMKDVIGLYIFGGIIGLAVLWFVWSWIAHQIDKLVKKFKK